MSIHLFFEMVSKVRVLSALTWESCTDCSRLGTSISELSTVCAAALPYLLLSDDAATNFSQVSFNSSILA